MHSELPHEAQGIFIIYVKINVNLTDYDGLAIGCQNENSDAGALYYYKLSGDGEKYNFIQKKLHPTDLLVIAYFLYMPTIHCILQIEHAPIIENLY